MQIRKLAVLCAIALVAIGCVAAAGCTSTPASQTMDPITGVWFSDYLDVNGNHLRSSLVIGADGTGVCYDVYDDSTVAIVDFIWTTSDDGTYAIVYEEGSTRVFTLNEAKDTITSSGGAVAKRVSSLADQRASIVGPWCNEKTKTVTIFNADGTGSIYKSGEVIGTFTWKNGEPDKFNVHYDTGGFAGHDAVWEYGREKDIARGDDGMFSVVRPTESVEGVTVFG